MEDELIAAMNRRTLDLANECQRRLTYVRRIVGIQRALALLQSLLMLLVVVIVVTQMSAR